MSLQIVITDAGRAEIINAENNGTAPVTISEIGFGSGQYTASAAQTTLQSEFKRLNTISGASIGDDNIHVTARDEGTDAYQVYEFGLYLASGTLFAAYSQNTSIIDKTTVSIALLAVDIVLQSINPASVTFGDASFINPPATTENEGVVELATIAETQAGTDSNRAVTPSSLSSRTATTTRTGLVELATNAETQAGTDSNRAVTPASLSSRTATTERTGLVELATNTETQTGADSNRAVTPASLSSRTATTERTGLVELANNSEALAGTDTSRAITAKGAHDAFKQFGPGTIDKPFQLTSIEEVDAKVTEGGYEVSNVPEMPVHGFGHLEVKSKSGSRTFQIWRPIVAETSSYSEFGRLSTDGGVTWTPFSENYNAETIPSSTTSSKGVVELATNTETQAGTDSNRAVTPASLSSRTATTERTGLVELASNSEALAGTDTSRAITAKGAHDAFKQYGYGNIVKPNQLSTISQVDSAVVEGSYDVNNVSELPVHAFGHLEVKSKGNSRTFQIWRPIVAETSSYREFGRLSVDGGVTWTTFSENYNAETIPSSTTSSKGIVELATNAETQTGSDSNKAVTPAGVKAYADNRNLYGEDNNEMVGSVAYFITTVAPDGWIKANGAAVSRAAYAKLFAKVGTFWGNGNGSTTFNVPDLRGEFIRCWDDGRGVDSGRSFGTFQDDELKSHSHTLPSRSNGETGDGYVEDANSGGTVRTAYTGLTGGSETRPRNVALVAYIKY